MNSHQQSAFSVILNNRQQQQRSSSPPVMRRLSPTTIATLSGQKRPSDAAYNSLSQSLQPINLSAMPQRKSLKRVYGPIRPPPPTDAYLENLKKTTLIPQNEKTKRYRKHVTNAWTSTHSSPTGSPQQPRIRFGKKQTVRIPKKTEQFKKEWRKLKQQNRALKNSIFPNLAFETDEDRTLTDQLIVDLPSDVEEETEAIVHSPTVVEEPIPDIPPLYKIHTYVKNSSGNIMRIEPNEQTVMSSTLFEDLLVLADDVAEENGLHPLNTFIGVVDENNIFHPFEITYGRLSHKLYSVNKHLINGIITVVYDMSPAKSGGKRKPRKK
jgi:hypothetical protein